MVRCRYDLIQCTTFYCKKYNNRNFLVILKNIKYCTFQLLNFYLVLYYNAFLIIDIPNCSYTSLIFFSSLYMISFISLSISKTCILQVLSSKFNVQASSAVACVHFFFFSGCQQTILKCFIQLCGNSGNKILSSSNNCYFYLINTVFIHAVSFTDYFCKTIFLSCVVT